MAFFKVFQVVRPSLKCLKVSPKGFKAAMCYCLHFFSLQFTLGIGIFEYKHIQF